MSTIMNLKKNTQKSSLEMVQSLKLLSFLKAAQLFSKKKAKYYFYA